MEIATIKFILTIAPAVSATFAGLGLILNYLAIKENNKTRQTQYMSEIFDKIQSHERLLYTDYKNANKKEIEEWDSLFFNSIEYFAFLINENYIKDEKIINFFGDAIINWYENIFVKHSKQTIL